MSDNLVEQLRIDDPWCQPKCADAADRIEELEANINIKADFIDATINQLAASDQRIEELEAKISKCVGALGDISNGEPEWPDDPQRELDWCRNRAGTTLAELKGGKDA